MAIHARDDPFIHCDTLRAAEFAAGNEHLMFLITEKGGHCGWPWGWDFPSRGWQFTNSMIEVFVETLFQMDASS